MRKTLIIVGILCSMTTIGQELDCSEFRNGVFFAEVNEPFKAKWKITRTGNEQVEEVIEIPKEVKDMGYPVKPHFELIEWIDNCSYKLKYDESKAVLSESQKVINENGGVLSTITKIEGNCYYYTSTLLINGTEQIINGIICKE